MTLAVRIGTNQQAVCLGLFPNQKSKMSWDSQLSTFNPQPSKGFTAKPERGNHVYDEPKGFIGRPPGAFGYHPKLG
jgi:hypothetical protein